MCFLSYFLYGFLYYGKTADLQTVLSDRSARVFNRSQVTRAVTLGISKTSDRVRHAGLSTDFTLVL